MVIDVVFLMDSMVALSWTLYMEKQWKMYIYNRVKSIVRLIEWTMCSTEKLPMYHIPGNCNLADLLTKHHNIWPNQLGVDSLWQNCHEWMRLPLADMPVTTYNKEYTREDYNNLHTFIASKSSCSDPHDAFLQQTTAEVYCVFRPQFKCLRLGMTTFMPR